MYQMSHDKRFPTMWYVLSAKAQTSLPIWADWSEPSLVTWISVKLLTEHHSEFLSLKEACTGSSESIHVKMPHCWKSHDTAQIELFYKPWCSLWLWSCRTGFLLHFIPGAKPLWLGWWLICLWRRLCHYLIHWRHIVCVLTCHSSPRERLWYSWNIRGWFWFGLWFNIVVNTGLIQASPCKIQGLFKDF